jgi:4-hydroxy-3-methylbut-2-enyl diphosphate reductase IspH
MCPAATVAVRENKPFMQLFRSIFKSPPLEKYIKAMQSRLAKKGVRTEVFESRLYHHWFMCMWTANRRENLRKRASQYDAVIVLGCDSATETVREAVQATGRKVVEGMKVSGIMNAQIKFQLPGNVCFENCRTVSIHDAA